MFHLDTLKLFAGALRSLADFNTHKQYVYIHTAHMHPSNPFKAQKNQSFSLCAFLRGKRSRGEKENDLKDLRWKNSNYGKAKKKSEASDGCSTYFERFWLQTDSVITAAVALPVFPAPQKHRFNHITPPLSPAVCPVC